MSSSQEAKERRLLLDRLLDEALDLEGDALDRFLDENCPESSLRADLESLIRGAGTTVDLGEKLGWLDLLSGPRSPDSHPSEPAVGETVGPWRLQELLGRGGMGTVFLAERQDGHFQMHAALKVSHRPSHDQAGRERFERERQILARLKHPAIARLLDGGVTENGLPYFVMEHIEGEPLDAYCDRHRLSIDQRLRLFVELARGLEVAHRQLIVHRDLKPSNTLVTPSGEPKLLDFGIAKLLDESVRPNDGPAAPATQLMTPEYASPEQLLGGAVGVATDIYQLGLMLYELLTGLQPHRFEGETTSQMLLRASRDDVVSPSTRMKRESRARTGGARSTSPKRLIQQLQGDLDAILLKALEREPDRRYGSVAELVADVERHLNGQPILARPDTLAYRSAKFVRRNAFAVTAVTMVVALVVTLVTFYTLRLEDERNRAIVAGEKEQAARIEAERRRDESDAVVSFLEGLFQAANPKINNGREITVFELLDQGAERTTTELKDQPLVAARLQSSIGRVYSRMGRHEKGAPLVFGALELRRRHLDESDPDLATSVYHAAILSKFRGRYDEAERYYLEAEELASKHPAGRSLLEGIYSSYGNLLNRQGRLEDAEQVFLRALEQQKTEPDIPAEFQLATWVNLGLLYIEMGRPDEAYEFLTRARRKEEQIYGEGHIETTDTLNNLGIVAFEGGDLKAGLELFQRIYEIRKRVLGEAHGDVAGSLTNIGLVKIQLGELDGAEQDLNRAVELFESLLGPEHFRLVTPLEGLGQVALARADGKAAKAMLSRAEGIRLQYQGDRHPDFALTLMGLALADELLGNPTSAEAGFSRALGLLANEDGEPHSNRIQVAAELGSFLMRRERATDAVPMLQSALEQSLKQPDPDHPRTAEIRDLLREARQQAES